MNTFRLAVASFELRRETSFEAFAAHIRSVVLQAVEGKAQAVLLPELLTTGLLGTVTDHEVTTATVAQDYHQVFPAYTDQLVDLYRTLAAEFGITIVGGSHQRRAGDGSLRNTCFVLDPSGNLVTQDKLHLTPPEHAMGVRAGDDVAVFDLGPFRAAVQICADIEFPEVSRHLQELGVNLILCPSLTWNRRGAQRVRYGAHARAMENQLWVASAPLVGSSGLPNDAAIHATGYPLVTGPIDKTIGSNDGVIARGDEATEQVIFADLSLDALIESRERPEVPGLTLRRPDLYARLSGGPDTAVNGPVAGVVRAG